MSDLSKIMSPLEYIRTIDEDSRKKQYNEYEVAQYIELYNDYVVSKLANEQQEIAAPELCQDVVCCPLCQNTELTPIFDGNFSCNKCGVMFVG